VRGTAARLGAKGKRDPQGEESGCERRVEVMLSVACYSESKGLFMIPQDAAQNSNDPRQRIEALGQRITEHVQFICAPGTSSGTSAEVREKALAAF
jgi:hypothetical protein